MSGLVHLYLNGCTVVWYYLLVFTGGDLFMTNTIFLCGDKVAHCAVCLTQ